MGEPRGISVQEMRRQVQMVFQDSASSLNPRMPVQNSIAFGPIAFGTPKDQAVGMARELLVKVGLNPALFGGRYPHELSGGQKQRINIARALALKPRMIILDEAVSALDKSVEAQVLNLLQALKRDLNLTYLFISHDLGVVRWISDRVLVMYLGEVVEIGPADAIYTNPKHPYTRALLASTPGILGHGAAVPRTVLTGELPSPLNPPLGCVFSTRCPNVTARCRAERPALRELDGRQVACHEAETFIPIAELRH